MSQLLFVGKASAQKLKDLGITTIGRLAVADRKMLSSLLGKWGETLSVYARGEDDAPVRGENDRETLKSVGNSITHYEDITDRGEVKRLLYVLSESVAARMRDAGLGKADTVHLWVRDCDMGNHTCQKKVRPTALCGDIAEAAYALFCEKYRAGKPVRGLGVTASGFDLGVEQLTFEALTGDYDKRARAEEAVAKIREKHGYSKLQRGIMYEDPVALRMDVRGERLSGIKGRNKERQEERGSQPGGENENGEF